MVSITFLALCFLGYIICFFMFSHDNHKYKEMGDAAFAISMLMLVFWFLTYLCEHSVNNK